MEARIVQLPTPAEVPVEPTGSSSSAWSSATRPSPRSSRSARRKIVRRSSNGPCGSGCSRSRTPARPSTSTSSGRSSRSSCARPSRSNTRAAEALDQTLRPNFADGDGRLPRTLERFLGDRGALRAFVERAVRRDEARQRDRPDARRSSARTSTATRRGSRSCSTPPASTPRCTSSGVEVTRRLRDA